MKGIVVVMIALVVLMGCATINQPVTSNDGNNPPGSIHNTPKGCYIMKKINQENKYDCFGCVNGNCKKEDLSAWEYVDQDELAAKGYSYICRETPQGCEIAVSLESDMRQPRVR